jgi:hypothetical protein
MTSGQLDDTRLTLRDLNLIVDSFTVTLQSIYHPRVQYPRLETPPASAEADTIPTAQWPKAPTAPPADNPRVEGHSGAN